MPIVEIVADDSKGETPKQAMLELAKRRHKVACDADQKQREREKTALRFQSPDEQWDEAAKAERAGNPAAGIPARPLISIPRINQPIQLVLNQERNSRLGVNIQPCSPEATTEVAEHFEGHYRAIERESNAHDARGWAFERAVSAGRGYYRILTTWDESTGNPWDQKIVIERILDQASVHFDPAAQKVDNSDAEYVFVDRWMTAAEFKRQYPTTEVPTGGGAFLDDAAEQPEWIQDEEGEPAVLVTEYFYKEHVAEEVSLEVEGFPKQTRKKDMVRVRWATLTGWEVIEEQEWNGKYLPIVTVVGKELQQFDGERRYQGMIEPAMGAQKAHNYWASNAIEVASLEPKAPWVLDPRQIGGYEEFWKQSNVRNFPFLPYDATAIQGAQPPQRAQIDSSKLGISMQMLQMSDNWIQSATATFDPALGRQNPREKSGRAILALQEQSEIGNSHYIANLARAMEYEARVILDLIPSIYDRPGRVVRTLDPEDRTEEVMLNRPYYKHPTTQRPVAVMKGQQLPMLPNGSQPEVKTVSLSKKDVYTIAVTIGKTTNTLRQESQEAIGEILTKIPQLMPVIGPMWLERQDFSGHEEMAEALRKLRDQQYGQLFSEEAGGGPTPQQAQAQIQGLQGQIQQMGQQLQMAMQEIKTKQAEQQAKLEVAQIDAATKIKVAEIQAAAALASKGVEAKLDEMFEFLRLQHEEVAHREDMAHEVAMAMSSNAASEQAAQAQREHEMGMTAMGNARDDAQQAMQPQPQEESIE